LHLLSILFRNPNFLVLDEPTNDLDLPTLSILESFLQDFQGCVIIVSHDRYFMDKLVEHLFVFEGDANIRDYPGNYTQYREWQKEEDKKKTTAPKKEIVPEPVAVATPAADNKGRKMSFKEKRELELLEKEIEQLETEKKTIEATLASGELAFDKMEPMTHRIGEIIQLLDDKGMRWLELSEING